MLTRAAQEKAGEDETARLTQFAASGPIGKALAVLDRFKKVVYAALARLA